VWTPEFAKDGRTAANALHNHDPLPVIREYAAATKAAVAPWSHLHDTDGVVDVVGGGSGGAGGNSSSAAGDSLPPIGSPQAAGPAGLDLSFAGARGDLEDIEREKWEERRKELSEAAANAAAAAEEKARDAGEEDEAVIAAAAAAAAAAAVIRVSGGTNTIADLDEAADELVEEAEENDGDEGEDDGATNDNDGDSNDASTVGAASAVHVPPAPGLTSSAMRRASSGRIRPPAASATTSPVGSRLPRATSTSVGAAAAAAAGGSGGGGSPGGGGGVRLPPAVGTAAATAVRLKRPLVRSQSAPELGKDEGLVSTAPLPPASQDESLASKDLVCCTMMAAMVVLLPSAWQQWRRQTRP
jgi:hypothetical protein